MKTETHALIQHMLVQNARSAIHSASIPGASRSVIDEVERSSAALTDFLKSAPSVSDAGAGAAALDVIGKHDRELRELADFLNKGTGKGSSAHKMINRFIAIGEQIAPAEVLDQPIPAAS